MSELYAVENPVDTVPLTASELAELDAKYPATKDDYFSDAARAKGVMTRGERPCLWEVFPFWQGARASYSTC